MPDPAQNTKINSVVQLSLPVSGPGGRAVALPTRPCAVQANHNSGSRSLWWEGRGRGRHLWAEPKGWVGVAWGGAGAVAEPGADHQLGRPWGPSSGQFPALVEAE